MSVFLIFKIAAVGICVTVINQILKATGKDEVSTFVTLSGVMIVLYMVVPCIADLFEYLKQLFDL